MVTLFKWRSLVGLVLFVLGLLGYLKFRISLALPVALGTLLIAYVVVNVHVYHQLRQPTPDESLGLPQWASGALNARGDGSHLTVILYGFPPKEPLSTSDYPRIIRAVVQHFELDQNNIDVETYQDGLRIGFPKIPNPLFHAQFGSGAIKVKSRLAQLDLTELMRTFDESLKFVDSEVNRYLINPSKRHGCVLSLSDWPQAGISAKGLLTAGRLSTHPTTGNSIRREYPLGKKSDTWEITKHFVGV